jgi:putative ABC transport system ATP-binding protein
LLPLEKSHRHRQVMAALETVGLADRRHHLPSQLSGGQEQRIALARALAPDPPLLLGDEPTGDLDRENSEQVLSLVRLLCRELGKTFVMVTHDPKAAAAASRVLHMEKGTLVENIPA